MLPAAPSMMTNHCELEKEWLIQDRYHDRYYLLAYLGKVYRIYLNSPFPRDALLKLCLQHFKISTSYIEECLLIDTKTNEVVWRDEDLQWRNCYFLGFLRLGSRARASQGLKPWPLLDKPLYYKETTGFRLMASTGYQHAQVQEVRSWRSVKGERLKLCPFLDCGKSFSRSLDLALHFKFETGDNFKKCEKCNCIFKRKREFLQHSECCSQTKSAADSPRQAQKSPDYLQESITQIFKNEITQELINKYPPYKLPVVLKLLVLSQFLASANYLTLLPQSS